MTNSLPQRTRPIRRRGILKFERFSTGNELNASPCVIKQSGQICRRSSASDHNYGTTPEGLEIMMSETVRQESGRQMRQIVGYTFEVSNPHGEHNSSSRKRFVIFQPKKESFRQTIDGDDKLPFQLWHHPLFECDPVGRKCVQRHWKAKVLILDSLLAAKMLQGKVVVRIRKV